MPQQCPTLTLLAGEEQDLICLKLLELSGGTIA